MKSIIEYINESKGEKYFRFNFAGFEDTDIIHSIESIAASKSIYTEKTDNYGLKIKIKDSTAAAAPAVVEVIADFINAHSSEEDEAKAKKIASIEASLASLEEFIEPEEEDESDAESDGESDDVKESKEEVCPKCGKKKCTCKDGKCDDPDCCKCDEDGE